MAAPTEPPLRLIALLYGPDQPGLVARTASWIFERGGNIIHADQHRDAEAGVFFQRIEWAPPAPLAVEAHATGFSQLAEELGMRLHLSRAEEKPRVVVMASKIPHCFHDVLLRWHAGELPCEVVAVVSNHPDLEADAARFGVPFHVVEVSKANKAAAEARQVELIRGAGAELVVLARYMQVLSAQMLEEVGCPVINIHHSFLPAFAGARPYHQAYARGVKLIGATAHYATEDLDQGPIIQQDVARVSHRHSVPELVRKGRDLERLVLAQALRWHLERRVLIYANKTVVFD